MAAWRRVWIDVRALESGTRHYLRWYDDSGRVRCEAAGPNVGEAENRRREREFELNRGELSDMERVSLAEFVKEHLEVIAQQVRPGTLKEHRETLASFAGFAGDVPLTTISTRTAERFVARRLSEDAIKAPTVNKNLRTLQGIFERAIERGYLSQNPFRKVRRLREERKELRVLSYGEVRKLLKACPNVRWQAFVFTALTTGLRLGELQYLDWQDVDLKRGLILVRNKTGHATKSGQERTAPIVTTLRELLKKLKGKRRKGTVFGTPDGKRMLNNVQRDFQVIRKNAKITRCTVHDLRRTFISHLQMAGLSEAVAMTLAGHASADTTRKHYTRVLPEVAAQAPERLSYAGCTITATALSPNGRAKRRRKKTA